ncbi:MAG TPA: protein kinase [Kofleriaceae bacterium]
MRQPVPFGKYLLLDRISVGGMAEVFKAKSYGVEGFEKIIAIKRILPTMGEDRDFIKMFIDEAKIAGQLAHANICQIFELGRIDGSHFIAMEYIWGKDLLQIQNRLRKIKQPMPIAMACFSIAKVLEGLDYAHRKRDPLGRPLEIVHRDCSPQNVLVSYEGEVKVIDFGIAKATSRNSRTMAGVLKGKFGYMSPEQVRGLPLDRRSDIFALGTMLYECLTSDRLFQGETDFSTLEKVRNVDIRPPRELNPNIPEAVEAVILKALAKDVEDRYQWCSEMLADIQQWLMSQEVVFTAKSLASWLKDVFSTEIERERQQLEQYKRVGRDGLIATPAGPLPAAEAKLDVVDTLGEAGPVEGDPTMLGGPNFEDLEQAMAASAQPEVGPAPGSPAARGATPAPARRDDDNDFGEEAPTEIFGEIDHGGKPIPTAPPMAAGHRPSNPSQPPMSRPPKPPPNRPGTRPSDGMYAQPQISIPPIPGSRPPSIPPPNEAGFAPAAATPQPGFVAQSYAQPGSNNAPYYPGQTPSGTPNQMPITPPQPLNAQAPPGQVTNSRTLIGAAAPPGMPNYAGYQQGQSQPPPGYPMVGTQPPPYGQNPSHPQMHGYGSQPQLAGYSSQQNIQGYPGVDPNANPYGGYGGYPGAPTPAVDPMAPVPEGRKKSSIGRDVAIGVAIAAVVLGGFLAVKFLILDADSDKPAAGSGSGIATIEVSMPPNINADLFLDGSKERVAVVANGQKIPVTAGPRKVRIVAPNGQFCEQEISLPSSKTTIVECALKGSAAGSGSAGSAPADPGSAGSATADPGSAKPPDKSGAPPGIDVIMPANIKGDLYIDGVKVTSVVQGQKVPATVGKHKLRVVAGNAVCEQELELVAGKTTELDCKSMKSDKTVKPDKKPDKKPPPDKMPTEENPADKAAALDQGYLNVFSKPSAKISIDSKDTGLSTPISGRALPLPAGKHKVTFAIGNDRFTFTVTIKAGATETLSKDLQ